MKNFVLLAFMLISSLTFGQNVGINIALPEFNLDVRSIIGSMQGPDLQLATPTKDHYIRIFGGRPGDPKPFILFSENDDFRIATSTPPGFSNWNERMTFHNNGNIGIKETLPNATLHINGAQSDGISVASLKIDNSTDNNELLIDADDIDGKNKTLHINRLSTKDLTMVKGGGNMGINTDAKTDIKVTISGTNIDIQNEPINSPAVLFLESTGGFGPTKRMIMDGSSITSIDQPLHLNESSPRDIFMGIGGGRVGIGTSSLPTIGTGYKLSVQGRIISEGYRCQLSFAWPDYVFKDDYPLISISELENRIKEHGHLPGLPSAEQVEDEGVDLEIIQATLLKKIEEMSLYIIDLNKKVGKLEKENKLIKEALFQIYEK